MKPSSFHRFFSLLIIPFVALFLTSCEKNESIATGVQEREANVILVLLASKGIHATKTPVTITGAGAADTGPQRYNILVKQDHMTDAMAILNQNGLPRIQGTSLLSLFAKQGLMTSEMEETIRYHSGLAEELASTIRKIDGVIDADVQISFPPPETGIPGMEEEKDITASVYVKHQGIADDPNSHLVSKIKLLISGSISGLDINNVTVIPDRSRITDISLMERTETLTGKDEEYVSIWSIMMNKQSAARFRSLLFIISILAFLFAIALGWLIWKFYPIMRSKGGMKNFFKPAPYLKEQEKTPPTEEG